MKNETIDKIATITMILAVIVTLIGFGYLILDEMI